jgi:hypothetical protein
MADEKFAKNLKCSYTIDRLIRKTVGRLFKIMWKYFCDLCTVIELLVLESTFWKGSVVNENF